MPLPANLIVNADDFGLNSSVSKAILFCFEQQFINSTSILTNFEGFGEAVALAHSNPVIQNIGAHVNFAEGRPLTNFKHFAYLDAEGNWDLSKTNKVLQILPAEVKAAFKNEIAAQIEKALVSKLKITHLDSHLHLHALPCFFKLFLAAAKVYKLKLRLAQTYYENSYAKYFYRQYINSIIKSEKINYSNFFLTVDKFLKDKNRFSAGQVEIMLHPAFDQTGKLTDHTDGTSLERWVAGLQTI